MKKRGFIKGEAIAAGDSLDELLTSAQTVKQMVVDGNYERAIEYLEECSSAVTHVREVLMRIDGYQTAKAEAKK